jgi:hypothetical protein
MALEEKKPCPTYFDTTFLNVDEDDAATVGLEAPKKENRWCLIEVSKETLASLEAGESFHIKEHGAGQAACAALCTPDKTFALEFLENSNPMYLANVACVEMVKDSKVEVASAEVIDKENVCNAADGGGTSDASPEAVAKDETPQKMDRCTIFAQVRGNIFLKSFSADSQRVRDLLMPYPIENTGSEPGAGRSPFTFSSLQFQVAASPKELQSILEKGPYIERDGAWYWMPAAFEREVTDAALNLISINSLDVKSLDVELLYRQVQEHFGEEYALSSEILSNLLRPFAQDAPAKIEDAAAPVAECADKEVSKMGQIGKTGTLALDPEKIKIFHGTQLLRQSPARIRQRFDLAEPPARSKRPRIGGVAAGPASAGREASLHVQEFCSAFSALAGSETAIEDISKLLGDRMYIDEAEEAVHPLDAATLPLEPRERLKRLFDLSSHWRPERLSPLMAPAVHGIKVDAWLLKFVKIVYIEFEKDKEVRMMTKKFAALPSWN